MIKQYLKAISIALALLAFAGFLTWLKYSINHAKNPNAPTWTKFF